MSRQRRRVAEEESEEGRADVGGNYYVHGKLLFGNCYLHRQRRRVRMVGRTCAVCVRRCSGMLPPSCITQLSIFILILLNVVN
jgi:hypothetical protein